MEFLIVVDMMMGKKDTEIKDTRVGIFDSRSTQIRVWGASENKDMNMQVLRIILKNFLRKHVFSTNSDGLSLYVDLVGSTQMTLGAS